MNCAFSLRHLIVTEGYLILNIVEAVEVMDYSS